MFEKKILKMLKIEHVSYVCLHVLTIVSYVCHTCHTYVCQRVLKIERVSTYVGQSIIFSIALK